MGFDTPTRELDQAGGVAIQHLIRDGGARTDDAWRAENNGEGKHESASAVSEGTSGHRRCMASPTASTAEISYPRAPQHAKDDVRRDQLIQSVSKKRSSAAR